jgi:hypothetical protein
MTVIAQSYVTAEDYQRITGNTVAPDVVTDSLLVAATKLFDRIHGVAPGMFAPVVGSTTFTFSPIASSTLYLRDSRGLQYFLRGVTADLVEIDTNDDGTVDYAFDFNDAWVRGIPENAPTFGEAYTAIELLPKTTATLTSWPDARGSVAITSTLWGYAAVPGPVQARVIDIAHAMKQRGFTGSMSDLGIGSEAWVMHLIDDAYNHKIMAFA